MTKEDTTIVEETLYRLTGRLPKRELELMESEAIECEVELLRDISLLEEALKNDQEDEAIDAMLNTPLTPLDKYWTCSALLGRLRGDMMLPSILTVTGDKVPKPSNTDPEATALIELQKMKEYTEEHENPNKLLNAFKKIHQHRASFVFKKPVKPEDAPGYTDRIKFPMDLSMIRKMIVSRHIKSYADLHQYIGLICHNCVAFNGRETDYGKIAREFEAAADDAIRQACIQKSRSNTPVPQEVTSNPES